MKSSNALLGIIGAAAIGAVVGMLFAPNKGSETRQQIKDGSKDLADNLKSNVDSALEQFTDKLNSIKEDGKGLVAKGAESIVKGTKTANKEVQKA